MLDPTRIAKNPEQRALAKLMLNSMWGKFGQGLDKLQVRDVTEPQSFVELMDSDQHDIRYISALRNINNMLDLLDYTSRGARLGHQKN